MTGVFDALVTEVDHAITPPTMQSKYYHIGMIVSMWFINLSIST